MLNKANSIDGFIMTGKDRNEIESEVFVYIAAGHAKIVEGKKNSKRVEIKVDGLDFPFSGFVDTRSSTLSIIERSIEREEMVCLRFEQQRKKDVDPNISIKDLRKDATTARENTIKKAVGIYDYKNQNFILTKEAQTNPIEDSEHVKSQLSEFYFDVDAFFADSHVQQAEVV